VHEAPPYPQVLQLLRGLILGLSIRITSCTRDFTAPYVYIQGVVVDSVFEYSLLAPTPKKYRDIAPTARPTASRRSLRPINLVNEASLTDLLLQLGLSWFEDVSSTG
jgi:hypothetical protein